MTIHLDQNSIAREDWVEAEGTKTVPQVAEAAVDFIARSRHG